MMSHTHDRLFYSGIVHYDDVENRWQLAEPRMLFIRALEDIEYRDWIKGIEIGITEIAISERGPKTIQLKVFVDDQEIWFDIHPLSKKPTISQRGLFNLKKVGFYGYESKKDGFVLFTKNPTLGAAVIVDFLFKIFPRDVTHACLAISEPKHLEILKHLSVSKGFQNIQELTVLNDMNESCWYSLMKNLKQVQKVNMGWKSRVGDVLLNDSINYLKICNGTKLQFNQLASFDYGTIEIQNYPPNVTEILDFLDAWKGGEKPKLNRFDLKFKRKLSAEEMMQLQRYLRGKGRLERGVPNPRLPDYIDENVAVDLMQASDMETSMCKASYLLTPSSFKFFSFKSFSAAEEDIESEYLEDEEICN